MSGSEFYDHSTYPSNGASGSSSAMRSELELIEAGFGKLPDLSGNGLKIVAVNSGGTALEAITTTGTGSGVRATSPTFVTPTLGAATVTTVNGMTLTASTGTFTLTNGKTFSVSNTLTLAGTDGSTLNVGTGGTLGTAAYTAASDYAAAAGASTIVTVGTITSGTWNGVVIAPAYGGTGVANNAASTITISGSYASTFTLTGTTGVTFPTSGTLLSTAAAVTVAQGGTGLATLTANNVMLGNGTGNVLFVAPSTSGNVITSNGTTWESTAPATSGLTLLATLTPTAAATVSFVSTFSATYDNYLIIGDGIKPDVNDALAFRLGKAGLVDSGSVYYTGATDGTAFTSAATAFIGSSNNVIAAQRGACFHINVLNANDATNLKVVTSTFVFEDAAGSFKYRSRPGVYLSANAVTGISFHWAGAQNFAATGTIKVYGYKN